MSPASGLVSSSTTSTRPDPHLEFELSERTSYDTYHLQAGAPAQSGVLPVTSLLGGVNRLTTRLSSNPVVNYGIERIVTKSCNGGVPKRL